jgi:pantetheine-phosphate adenylyltransferase
MQSPRIALYPGSFDPVTRGHINLIQRSLSLFDKIIVGIAVNISKKPMFTFEQRAEFILEALPHAPVEVVTLDGLLVHEARRLQCTAILRGLRSGSDFDYEFRMTSMNSALDDDIETVFLMSDPADLFISSSLIKEVSRFGGDIDEFVPPKVAAALNTIHST